MTPRLHRSINPLVCALAALSYGVAIAQTSVLDRFEPLDTNGDGMPSREEREPASPQAGERLTPLDRHRLCLVREEALKRLDAKGVAKLVEIGDQLRSVPRWTAAHTGEFRLLLDQMEARYGLTAPDSVPSDAPPEATAFALPRREWRDVCVAESPGADAGEQCLDVYAPVSGERHPIVVFFHGGGMKAGDKAHPGVTVLKPDFFIARGFVFVSANYRLAPRHVHPAQAEDTAAALAWVHDHAAEYGGDPGRLFVIGISAGAHLAAVVATNERFLAARGKSPAIIAGAVILDIGSFDIPALMEQAGARAPEMYRYTFRNGGNADDWQDCSPSYHVRPGQAVPPLLLCYVKGREHHAQENERFAKLVRESGGEATVLAAAGKTHLSIEAEVGTRSDAVTATILHFVESHRLGTMVENP